MKRLERFKVSSELIQCRVITELFKTTLVVPEKCDDSLDIINILKAGIQFFDQCVVSRAFYQSFKTARDIYVNGKKNRRVPRESVYDTEMNRILINWIVKQRGIQGH